MAKINEFSLRIISNSIADALDKKDGNSDGRIEASIWNQFVNGKNDENGPQVGNGKQSEIREFIDKKDAVKSIRSYVMKKGTKLIYDVMKNLGIDSVLYILNFKVNPGDEVETIEEGAARAKKKREVANKYLEDKGYDFNYSELDDAQGKSNVTDYGISDNDKKRALNARGKNGYNYVEALNTYDKMLRRAKHSYQERFGTMHQPGGDYKPEDYLNDEDSKTFQNAYADLKELKETFSKENGEVDIDECLGELKYEVEQEMNK